MVGGQPGVLSIRFGSITPAKGGVGVGSTVLSGNWVAVGDCACGRLAEAETGKRRRQRALAVDRNSCRRFMLNPPWLSVGWPCPDTDAALPGALGPATWLILDQCGTREPPARDLCLAGSGPPVATPAQLMISSA